jgi:hypothetical protein
LKILHATVAVVEQRDMVAGASNDVAGVVVAKVRGERVEAALAKEADEKDEMPSWRWTRRSKDGAADNVEEVGERSQDDRRDDEMDEAAKDVRACDNAAVEVVAAEAQGVSMHARDADGHNAKIIFIYLLHQKE